MNLKNNQNNNLNSFEENEDINNKYCNYITQINSEQDNQKEIKNDSIQDNDIKNFVSVSSMDKEEILKNKINNDDKEDIKIEKNNNNNNITVSNLLFQLKQMSDKQLYLLDVISNLQKTSSEQINHLNKRIKDLEEKIIKKNENNESMNNFEKGEDNHKVEIDDPNIFLTKLLNGNNQEELINYLNELKLEQIKKLDIKLIEDTLVKLCILLTEGFKVNEIIFFIKGILIIYKIKLKEITKKNLKDVLSYIQNNLSNLKNEDSIDISLIISFLNI